MKKNLLFLTGFLLFLSSCEKADNNKVCGLVENSRELNQITKILFIGNSLTYTNCIPYTIKHMAKSAGDSTYTRHVAPGGFSFEQHSTYPETSEAIRSEKWDFVVLQGTAHEALPLQNVELTVYPHLQVLIEKIIENSADTKIIFYMINGFKDGVRSINRGEWCETDPVVCDYEGMQDRLKDTYIDMCEHFDAELAPAGILWKIFMNKYPDIDLFCYDGVHPSPEGSYISACAIYSTIFRKSPVGKYVFDDVGKYVPEKIKTSINISEAIQTEVFEVLFNCDPDWKQY